MTKEFDPYYEWLGISPKDQPPNHYRLLGIDLFEPNRNVIDAAANRQMGFIKEYQAGEHSEATQRLLNELSAARLCLLNNEKKAAYDAALRAREIPRRPSPLSCGQGFDQATNDSNPTAPKKHEVPVMRSVPMTPPLAPNAILPPSIDSRFSAAQAERPIPQSIPAHAAAVPRADLTSAKSLGTSAGYQQHSRCRVCRKDFVTTVVSPSQPVELECPSCRSRLGQSPSTLSGDDIVTATIVSETHVVSRQASNVYCRNCGSEVHVQAPGCLRCGVPPLAGNNFCWNCRSQTHPQAVICVRCGVSLHPASAASTIGRKKIVPKSQSTDPALACLLSVLLVGLGQVILGQTIKGVVMFLVACVLGALTMGGIWLITLPVSAIDAYLIAKKLKEGKSVGKWEFF